jgi:hypothetical protein
VRRSTGVALVLVLVLTMILGLLVSQLSLTTRAQTERAQALTDLTEQRLRLHSAETTILFALLTRPWVTAPPSAMSTDQLETVWRFDSGEFEMHGVQFRLQDLSGRLPFPQPGDTLGSLENALVELGYPSAVIREKTRKLTESYDASRAAGKLRPAPVQSMTELTDLMGLNGPQLEQIRTIFTLYPVTQFNINSASPVALRVRYPASFANAALMLRQSTELDAAALFRLMGVSTDEFTVFSPGPAFEVGVRVEQDRVSSESLSIWVIQPYELDALRLWERRKPTGAEAFR